MHPPTIDHFIGQPHVTEPLRVALEATWNSGKPLPHILMVGPPGCGKTALASILAAEVAGKLHEQIGQVLISPASVFGLIAEAADGDVCFIDEIHEMPFPSMTLLYRCLDDRKIYLGGRNDASMALPVADFTLISATTDAYAILPPLRDRHSMILEFTWYDIESLAAIVEQRAKREGIQLDPMVAREIAARSRGTPRLAIRLLKACERFAQSRGENQVLLQHFNQAVRLEGLDAIGLDRDQQRYLRFLANRRDAVRLGDIEAALGIHRRTLQTVVEPFLVRTNLVERMAEGRRITSDGSRHLDLLTTSQAIATNLEGRKDEKRNG